MPYVPLEASFTLAAPVMEPTVGALLATVTRTRPSAGVASAVTPESPSGVATTVRVPLVLFGVPAATFSVAVTRNGLAGQPCGIVPVEGQLLKFICGNVIVVVVAP